MIRSNAIIEIKKKNLSYNYNLLSSIANKSINAATIKADAYGLGDIEILKILIKAGCNHFFLATTEEAIKIRNINKKVNLYVLNGLENNKLDLFNKKNITPIFTSKEEIDIFFESKYIKSNFKFGIHIETGLNRLGVKIEDLDKKKFKKIKMEILISHLASSDELKNKYNFLQNINFKKSFKIFKSIKYKSLSASAGVMNNKKLHHDMIRPGISLYGGSCLKSKYKIKSVITLKGKILQIKDINKNEYIGYNQTYKTHKKIKVAIVGIGYGDGISRSLSNKGNLFFKEESFKILGRVSMDTITVNISNSKYPLKKGYYLEVINEKYTINEMAKKCSTISNEILTSISKRVKRVYT